MLQAQISLQLRYTAAAYSQSLKLPVQRVNKTSAKLTDVSQRNKTQPEICYGKGLFSFHPLRLRVPCLSISFYK